MIFPAKDLTSVIWFYRHHLPNNNWNNSVLNIRLYGNFYPDADVFLKLINCFYRNIMEVTERAMPMRRHVLVSLSTMAPSDLVASMTRFVDLTWTFFTIIIINNYYHYWKQLEKSTTEQAYKSNSQFPFR